VSWHEFKGGLVPDALYTLFPLLLSDAVHPNVMAALMLLFFPLALTVSISLWMRRDAYPWWQWLGAAVAAGVMLLILLLTRSRGGYLVATFGLLLVLWLTKQRWLAGATAVLATLAGLWLYRLSSQPSSEVVSAITDTQTVAFRQHVWRMALRMMADFPFTGSGMGSFNAVATRLYPFPQTSSPGTHNLYLQVGVDLGIVGLVAFVALLGTVLLLGWRTWLLLRQQGDVVETAVLLGTLLGLTTMLIHGLVDVTVWGTRMAFAPWLFVGVILAITINHAPVGK
jgi:putative inorganic carbon (HCO3(-)) transporter